MAGHRQHQVVMLGRHHLNLRAERLPERAQPQRRRLGRALFGGQNAPAPAEQRRKARLGPAMLGAGDRMPRHDRRMRQHGPQRGEHAFLRSADIADDRIGGQVVRELRRYRTHRADRHAQHHEVGIDHRRACRVSDIVGELDPLRDTAHLGRGVVTGDPHRRHRGPHRARHRRADQPQPDDRDAREGQHQPAFSTSARSTSTTARISSSVPIVMRRPWGSPWPGSQRVA
ncbi:hypothetical protein WR25_23502 [Diploscapter pachys]|uniref:Uncharacterized protein n=1 Tax=Diploscapter pachys TaxID=2018661 RepID=A0A2A2M4L3_9BILA|nr:hypothetical protein WR25_23502 [Diploscapter pachys]